MAHVTPIRVAAAGSLLAVLAGSAAPLLGFYLTVVAAAVLLGSAFVANLQVVDDARARRVAEAAVCALGGILVLVDASIRFPTVLGTSTPDSARLLAVTSLALTACAAALAAIAPYVWTGRGDGPLRGVRRSLRRRLRRLAEATRHAAQGS